MIKPETLITALNQSDPSLPVVFMYGSCYKFHLFLKKLYPSAVPLINEKKDHVITQISGQYFDISGVVDPDGFTPISEESLTLVQGWSFHKYMLMSLGDCPSCDEPILTDFHPS